MGEKSKEQKIDSLAGQLLIASPSIQESCFARSVVYLCAHNEGGAMGVIVNSPVENLNIREIFDQLDIDADKQMRDLPIHFGGPVEANRGFVVHSADEQSAQETLICKNGVAVTSSISVLQALAAGKGPSKGMLVLGYAGWSPGQLESEIETGSWILVPATKQLVFDTKNEFKWDVAVSALGIDMGHYSTGRRASLRNAGFFLLGVGCFHPFFPVPDAGVHRRADGLADVRVSRRAFRGVRHLAGHHHGRYRQRLVVCATLHPPCRRDYAGLHPAAGRYAGL